MMNGFLIYCVINFCVLILFFFLWVCLLFVKYVIVKKKIFKLKNVNMVYEDGFNYKDDKEFLFMFIIEIEWNFLWC